MYGYETGQSIVEHGTSNAVVILRCVQRAQHRSCRSFGTYLTVGRTGQTHSAALWPASTVPISPRQFASLSSHSHASTAPQMRSSHCVEYNEITVSWDVVMCSLVDRHYISDEHSAFLRNVGSYLPNYTSLYPVKTVTLLEFSVPNLLRRANGCLLIE
jgi:hypothetical protein